MAYLVAELEHVLGLRNLPETPEEHVVRKSAEEAAKRQQRDHHPDWAYAQGTPRRWVQTDKRRRRRAYDNR